MKYLAALLLCSTAWADCTWTWDPATAGDGQTIDGIELLVDGQVVDTTTAGAYPCSDFGLAPGDYALTVRHYGTVDGQPVVSPESNVLTLTVSGVPGVAPLLGFRDVGAS